MTFMVLGPIRYTTQIPLPVVAAAARDARRAGASASGKENCVPSDAAAETVPTARLRVKNSTQSICLAKEVSTATPNHLGMTITATPTAAKTTATAKLIEKRFQIEKNSAYNRYSVIRLLKKADSTL